MRGHEQELKAIGVACVTLVCVILYVCVRRSAVRYPLVLPDAELHWTRRDCIVPYGQLAAMIGSERP